MTSLAREVENIQNPALGAAIIWRFCCGYVEESPTREPTPMPVVFLTLPILLHQATAEFLRSTHQQSGLRAFASKFGASKHNSQDLLLQLSERAVRWRTLSLESLELAVAGRLLAVSDDGLVPLSVTPARGLPDRVKRLLTDAEKLGRWCGALTIHEIATTLKARL